MGWWDYAIELARLGAATSYVVRAGITLRISCERRGDSASAPLVSFMRLLGDRAKKSTVSTQRAQ